MYQASKKFDAEKPAQLRKNMTERNCSAAGCMRTRAAELHDSGEERQEPPVLLPFGDVNGRCRMRPLEVSSTAAAIESKQWRMRNYREPAQQLSRLSRGGTFFDAWAGPVNRVYPV
jgi:hypothetical protein